MNTMPGKTVLGSLLLAVLLMAGGCSRKAAEPTKVVAVRQVAATAPHCKHRKELQAAAADVSSNSVYAVGGAWSDDRGRKVDMTALRGQPVVVSMVYTTCGYACPMLTHSMKKIADALPEAQRARVHFVLVSMDPDRDTVARLAAYAKSHGLRPDSWTLLRGSDTDVRKLAHVLGVRYRREQDGSFSHSNRITLLDAEGAIAYRQDGLENEPDRFAAELKKML